MPTCASDWLLQDTARGAWGFDGYVTSDCGAEFDVAFLHNYTRTPEEAVRRRVQHQPALVPRERHSVWSCDIYSRNLVSDAFWMSKHYLGPAFRAMD